MALEGTHIKFAADLKDKVGVSDMNKYISGTIYPDSRYITKLERVLTHSKDYIEKFLHGDDDFRKGWAMHLICDRSQKRFFRELFPEFYVTGESEQGNDVWVSETAVKLLQDVDVIQQTTIQQYLPCLEYVENPNGEDVGIIKKYNAIFQRAYSRQDVDPLEARYITWEELGLGTDTMSRIKKRVEEFQQDLSLLQRINILYGKMLEQAFIK